MKFQHLGNLSKIRWEDYESETSLSPRCIFVVVVVGGGGGSLFSEASEMSQRDEMDYLCKPGNLSSIPITHKGKRRGPSIQELYAVAYVHAPSSNNKYLK